MHGPMYIKFNIEGHPCALLLDWTETHWLLKCYASLKKIRWWAKSQKKMCQLTSVVQISLIWISWPLKMGLINCPRTSVRNYYSLMCDSSEEHRSHLTIWQCRPGFGPSWSRSEQSGLAQSSSVLCMHCCIVVVVLCALLSYVYMLNYVGIAVFYFRCWTAG